MKGCGRVLAGFALLLFITSAAAAASLLTVRFYLLSPQTYSKVLGEEGIFDDLPGIVAEQMLYSMSFNPCLEDPETCEGEIAEGNAELGGGGPPEYFASLSVDVWESVIASAIDPLWIETTVVDILEQLFALLTEDSQPQAIEISLEMIKTRIRAGAGLEAVLQVMQAQPDCTADQVFEITQAIASQALNDVFLQCNPPQEIITLVEPYVQDGLNEIVRPLPARLEIDIPQEIYSSDGPATLLSVVRAAFRFTPWIAAFWLMVVTVLVVRDARTWAGWWGTGLFFAGLATLGVGFAVGPSISWFLERVLLDQTASGFSPELIATGMQVVKRLFEGFSRQLMIVAGIMLGMGLLLLLLRLFTRPASTGQIGSKLNQARPNS